jgi:hypothetical protein
MWYRYQIAEALENSPRCYARLALSLKERIFEQRVISLLVDPYPPDFNANGLDTECVTNR